MKTSFTLLALSLLGIASVTTAQVGYAVSGGTAYVRKIKGSVLDNGHSLPDFVASCANIKNPRYSNLGFAGYGIYLLLSLPRA
jgi:hypothetical protein